MINCFFITRLARRQRVATALLAGAIDYAFAGDGAERIDVYPIDPAARVPTTDNLFVGYLPPSSPRVYRGGPDGGAPAGAPGAARSRWAASASSTREGGQMKQRRLGGTGYQVSEVGFGSWALGGEWGEVSEADAMGALHAALDAGVTFFDTADVYGDGRSEKYLAAFAA